MKGPPAVTAPAANGSVPLTLAEVHARTGIGHWSLKAALEAGDLRGRWGQRPYVPGKKGSRTGWMIEEADLESWLTSLEECRYPPCTQLGAGPLGCCSGPHAIAVLTEGVPRSEEARARMSAALKGQPRARRGRVQKTSDSLRRFYASPAGSDARTASSEALCTPERQLKAQLGRWGKHGAEYQERARAQFEKAIQGQLAPSIIERPCFICGRVEERERWTAAHHRTVCNVCKPLWNRALVGGRTLLRSVDPTVALTNRHREAFALLLPIAEEFDSAVRARWPRNLGRRPPLQADLIVEVLFARGFSDAQIRLLLEEALHDGLAIPGVKGKKLNGEYVKTRRKRISVHRSRPRH